METQTKYSAKIKPTEQMLRSRRKQVFQMYPDARVFEVQIEDPVLKAQCSKKSLQNMPSDITVITPVQDDYSSYQIFIGGQPISENNWSFNEKTFVLSFKQGSGDSLLGGQIRMVKDWTSGFGILQVGDKPFSVQIHVKPVTYDMQCAITPAAYAAGTSTAPALKWDAGSDSWKNADWSAQNMHFTYGIEQSGTIAGQPVYFIKCTFTDMDTNETWEPLYGTYTAYLTAGMLLVFSLNQGYKPQPDPYNPFSKFISKRFPYLFNAQLDAFARTYNGAMLCEQNNLKGTVYALEGVYDASSVNGIYTLFHDNMADGIKTHVVAVHNGKLWIDNEKAEESHQTGNRIEWNGIPDETAKKIGIPSSGYLRFSSDGSKIIEGSANAAGERISPDKAVSLIDALPHLRGAQNALSRLSAQPANDAGTLNLMDLLNMNQYEQDDKGWYDAVQQDSMTDFYDIIQYYMPDDLRKEFVNPNPVDLDPTVKGIAQMDGSKTKAKDFYNVLSTSYLTGMLSQWSNDPASKYLNGVRANKWVKAQTGVSDVFAVQGPALYANRYSKKNPLIEQYINDQIVNAGEYSEFIDEDVVSWKNEMKETVETDDQGMADLMATIDDIAAHGKNNQYWSYVVMRYTNEPAFLNMLQSISFNPDGLDGSEFVRTVQKIAALLNVLDPSSYFTQQFAYNIQLFQTANILPQLLDYSGDLDDYSYAVNAILEEFVNKYINSADPDMQKAAEAYNELLEQGQLNDIMQVFQQACVSMGGLYSWGQMVATFQSKAAVMFSKLPELAVKGVALTAVTFGMVAFATGQIKWKDLTTMQQLSLVSCGVGLLVQVTGLIVKRGIALVAVLNPGSGFGAGLKLFFSPKLLTEASQKCTTGFKGWLLGDGKVDAAQTMEEAATVVREEGEAAAKESTSVTEFLFGRNLDEFVATRLGTIMAVSGVIMCAIFLAESSDPFEIAANAMFLFSSALDLFCVAGAWIIGGTALKLTSVGAFMTSTLFPILGVIGIIAVVAGAILMIIFMTEQKPSPVESFAETTAKDAGYYMPYGTEIDYFEIYQSENQPQRAGLSLTDGQSALNMQIDGTVTLGNIDHTSNTAFYMTVDEYGRASFVAPLKDDEGKPAAKYLTLDDNGNVTAADAIADTTKNSQQLWRAEMLGDAVYDGDDNNKYLSSAPFAFYNEYYYVTQNKKMYITVSGSAVIAGSSQQSWTAQMVTTAPEGLNMNDITLYVYNKDLSFSPSFVMPGSNPKTWSVTPSLPDYLSFASDTGTISQKEGVAPSLLNKTEFSIKASNCVSSDSADFNIQVLADDQQS